MLGIRIGSSAASWLKRHRSVKMPPPPWPRGNPDTLTGAVEVAAVAAVAVEPPPLPATVKPMDTPTTASTTATAATDRRCFRHLRVLLAAGGGVHGGVFILRMVPAEHEAAVGKKW